MGDYVQLRSNLADLPFLIASVDHGLVGSSLFLIYLFICLLGLMFVLYLSVYLPDCH